MSRFHPVSGSERALFHRSRRGSVGVDLMGLSAAPGLISSSYNVDGAPGAPPPIQLISGDLVASSPVGAPGLGLDEGLTTLAPPTFQVARAEGRDDFPMLTEYGKDPGRTRALHAVDGVWNPEHHPTAESNDMVMPGRSDKTSNFSWVWDVFQAAQGAPAPVHQELMSFAATALSYLVPIPYAPVRSLVNAMGNMTADEVTCEVDAYMNGVSSGAWSPLDTAVAIARKAYFPGDAAIGASCKSYLIPSWGGLYGTTLNPFGAKVTARNAIPEVPGISRAQMNRMVFDFAREHTPVYRSPDGVRYLLRKFVTAPDSWMGVIPLKL